MISVLMVSKPLVPPWSDSGKNLARDVATFCPSVNFTVMGTPGSTLGLSHVTEEPIYSDAGAYSPSKLQNLKVLWRLLAPNKQELYHFFFAPNTLTGQLARAVVKIKRRKSVHSVLSVPRDFEAIHKKLASNVVVALSDYTAQKLKSAGIKEVTLIPPGIPVTEPISLGEQLKFRKTLNLLSPEKPIIIFPGDYEFSDAAQTVADAIPRVLESTDALFIFACRLKTGASKDLEDTIRKKLASYTSDNVLFLNHVDQIHHLLACASLALMPASSTYAKMDLPLVLLEAMAEKTPLIVADSGPLPEILKGGGGVLVPPSDPKALADQILVLLADSKKRQKLGEEARMSVETHFSALKMAENYGKLYQKLMGKK